MKNYLEKKHNVLFVSYTALHVYLAKKIAREYYGLVDNFICQIEGFGKFSDDDFSGYLKIDNNRNIFDRKEININYNKILDYIKENNIGCIFLVDIASNLMNNKLFFSKELQHCDFYIYSDGLAVYKQYKSSFYRLIKDAAKYLLSFLGITAKYMPVGHDVFGISHKNIRGVYAFNSHLVPTGNKKYDIPVPELKVNKKDNGIIFIGQPIWMFCSDKKWMHYLENVITYLKMEYPEEKKYYKTHIRCKAYEKRIFSEADFVVIEENICFEELAEQLGFKSIFSCISTVLLHSKWMYNDVQIFSLMTKSILNNAKGCLQVFYESGESQIH